MSVVIWSIEIYQRHISPHKGFCCAYRIATHGLSCSEYAKQRIVARGFLKALADIRQRFQECKQAAAQLNELSERARSKSDNFIDRHCGRYYCDPSACCIGLPGDGCACTPF